jgi:hypothetical protein
MTTFHSSFSNQSSSMSQGGKALPADCPHSPSPARDSERALPGPKLKGSESPAAPVAHTPHLRHCYPTTEHMPEPKKPNSTNSPGRHIAASSSLIVDCRRIQQHITDVTTPSTPCIWACTNSESPTPRRDHTLALAESPSPEPLALRREKAFVDGNTDVSPYGWLLVAVFVLVIESIYVFPVLLLVVIAALHFLSSFLVSCASN